MNHFLFLLFSIFLFVSNSIGQSESNSDFFNQKRFNAGFVFGVNASELTGKDGFGSFIGPNLGIFGIADLNKKMHLSLELLWSQNGEYLTPDFFPDVDYSKIKLNYIEIPVQLNFRLRQKGFEGNRFGWLRTGIAYAHLLDYQVYRENINVTNQIIFGNRNALLVNFGGAYFFNQHWGINVRMSIPIQANDLIPSFSFRGIYLL